MPDPQTGSPGMDELLRKERHLRILHDFALSILEARSVDELLWQVASGAIARLGFADFAIYMLDEERQVLVQRAAHGPKSPRPHQILERLEFPVGEGIIGAVAKSGRGILVPDTRNEKRYIAEYAGRLSEIALPILHEGKVLGVMDSESPELNAFSQEDFELLRTLASMVGARVVIEHERANSEAKLRKAFLTAEEAGRAKSRFLANISHEVRTPLVAVLGLTEMVKGLIEARAPEEVVQDHLAVISKSGTHLLSILNQVLDISSDEHQELKLDLRPAEPLKILREAVDLFRHRASEGGLSLKAFAGDGLPESILTDTTRLRQILVNLIDNAIKFTDEGAIRVELSTHDGLLCFLVADTGVGVEPEELKSIFQSFHQTDSSTTRRHSGVGLGLAISQRLAQRLGGDLTMSSVVGVGSEFLLELPIRTPGEEDVETAQEFANDAERPLSHEPAQSEVEEQQSEKESTQSIVGDECGNTSTTESPVIPKRLLLAEDNDASRKLITLDLRAAGHTVVCAVNGREALQEACKVIGHEDQFDVILLDMQMPLVDGFTVARELRRLEFSQPIVALTAHSLPGDRDACLEAGCSHYLAKPFKQAELLALIADPEST